MPKGINKTDIEWCDYTWNPVTGCLNNCSYCYARRIATRFAGTPAFPNGFKPTFHSDRITAPYYMKGKGWKIFTCSMGELFMENYEHWTNDVLETVNGCDRQTFILLTKQAKRLWQWSPFPGNCWVGASATCESEVVDACRDLCSVQAPVKFLSLEPLLKWDKHKSMDWFGSALALGRIRWVIIGAQTQPYLPPPEDSVIEILRALAREGIPVFLKNNLKKALGLDELRQEWPEP